MIPGFGEGLQGGGIEGETGQTGSNTNKIPIYDKDGNITGYQTS